ncbi:hypothetical protein PAXRUDRAFT_826663 [Paxillus rubicundulus Ve08.2h10]|uniref:Uncharacterized protein n=1 Tax=Paxillus rubicundulus Ve08.2h10 TaxID=930991 RepID=A0A0D0DRM8_9AGAM|nr:hypothetical protein PAXRUDRAFT_826663 [Paxillus rubicundulus Ve08.2h10]
MDECLPRKDSCKDYSSWGNVVYFSCGVHFHEVDRLTTSSPGNLGVPKMQSNVVSGQHWIVGTWNPSCLDCSSRFGNK